MKGFTLIEVLVAIAISSIIAIIAYSGLDTLIDSKRHVELNMQKLEGLQNLFMYLERDIEQSVPRVIRNEYGITRPSFVASQYGEYRLELTRGGYRNPAKLQRSNLQRVAYSVDNNDLYRIKWRQLDRGPHSEPSRSLLLKNIDQLRFRFMDSSRRWHVDWPPGDIEDKDNTATPIAVEIRVKSTGFGELTRLLLLRDG